MPASIAVENLQRAAAACSALSAAAVKGPAPAVTVLRVATELSVEAVIEAACVFGCHAEEIRHGVVEFWIGEWAALELITPEASASIHSFPLAA